MEGHSDSHGDRNGHAHATANGHKPSPADEHTDLGSGSGSHWDANGNKPSHQHTRNIGDHLSHEHCDSDENSNRNTFAHPALRQAQDTVVNRPPDLNAHGLCGHAPATDGNRNLDGLKFAPRYANPDSLEPASKCANPNHLDSASKDANPYHYTRSVADIPSPCGFGLSLVSGPVAHCSWSRAGMVGLFIHQKEALMKHVTLFLIPALILALIAFYLFAPLDRNPALAPVEAQDITLQNPTVRIDPTESVVGVGDSFTVSVMIDNVSDLGGFEFDLFFVTTTVRVDSVAVGDFPGSAGRMVIPAVGPIIDNQAGRASLGVVTVGSAPGPSGTGVLATVTLTTQGSGESPLDLQGVLVVDTHAEHKTTTVEDGVVLVRFAIYLPLILKDR